MQRQFLDTNLKKNTEHKKYHPEHTSEQFPVSHLSFITRGANSHLSTKYRHTECTVKFSQSYAKHSNHYSIGPIHIKQVFIALTSTNNET